MWSHIESCGDFSSVSKHKYYYQLHQQIMIFWGPVVGLWITQVVAVGPVYLGLFSDSEFGTWPDFSKKTRDLTRVVSYPSRTLYGQANNLNNFNPFVWFQIHPFTYYPHITSRPYNCLLKASLCKMQIVSYEEYLEFLFLILYTGLAGEQE